jgi:hypothetical protein
MCITGLHKPDLCEGRILRSEELLQQRHTSSKGIVM